MKRNIRRFGLIFAIALGLIVLAVPRSAAAYQHDDDQRNQAQDQNRRGDDDNARRNEQMDQDRSYGIQRQGDQPGNLAERYGYQDGLTQGMHDRQSGRHARPSDDANYKHGLRGYQSSMGDRNQYQQAYRQAYQQGYDRGYNGNGYNQQDRANDRDRRTDRPRDDDHNRDRDDQH